MSRNLLLILLIGFSLFAIVYSEQELQMVVELFRHGARGPIFYDPWYIWDHEGELTPNGARMHFVLGRELKKRYAGFLPAEFDPSLIRVQSTNFNRTIQSALSQLYGIFSTDNDTTCPHLIPDYNSSLTNPPDNLFINETSDGHSCVYPQRLNAIPVHVTGFGFDYILKSYFGETCSYMNNLTFMMTDDLFTPKYQAFREEIQPIVEESVNRRWIPSVNASSREAFLQTAFLWDVIIANYNYGNEVPMEPGDELWTKYQYAFDVVSQIIWNSHPLQYQLGSANFLNAVLEHFNNKVKNQTTYKFLFYSAHDSNIVPILTALNQLSVECLLERYRNPSFNNPVCTFPTYASNILFELWRDSENPSEYRVKVIYNDMVLQLCGQDTCDLNSFANVISVAEGGQTLNKYFSTCNYGPSPMTTPGILAPMENLAWLETMLFVLMIVLTIGVIISLKRKVVNTLQTSETEIKPQVSEA